MKPALLDLNVLVALAWPSHIHHEAAHQWFAVENKHGWATCPITQTGLIRLSSNPKILPDAVTPTDAINSLNQIVKLPDHQFWSDDLSINEAIIFQKNKLIGHRQITDAYLLSLAIQNKGRLITFDKGIKNLLNKLPTNSLLIL